LCLANVRYWPIADGQPLNNAPTRSGFFVPDKWADASMDELKLTYCSGNYDLAGSRGDKPWELTLHVGVWARAVPKFLDAADSDGLTFYIGQDWY
jgi:hypothetical protein